jgi:hypothetical protein
MDGSVKKEEANGGLCFCFLIFDFFFVRWRQNVLHNMRENSSRKRIQESARSPSPGRSRATSPQQKMMGSPSGAGECEEEERPASPADEEIDRSKGKETESEENEQVQVYDDNMLEAKK